jgi:prolyl-tRNA editing enzyme YbaK/EbsC (Cys-tRNA(Pro) deacylase)
MVKSLALYVEEARLLLLAPCSARVDFNQLAVSLCVTSKQVRMATTEECVREFGYPPGCMPPVGLRSHNSSPASGSAQNEGQYQVLLDRILCEHDTVFVGCGAWNAFLGLPLQALFFATSAQVCPHHNFY